MADDAERLIGHAMFSRFSWESMQVNCCFSVLWQPRLHFSVSTSPKRLEYGFEKKQSMEFQAVMAEGDPKNYTA
ncbi:MAG: hypothetical protein IJ246_02195 [Clostridia bacterium]|nr:hypothetical protein [Clostridia bacterium]